jgi:hypothetical protein
MYQGTQGYSLMKKTEGRKSRDTVSLKATILQTGASRCKADFSDLVDFTNTRDQNRHHGFLL